MSKWATKVAEQKQLALHYKIELLTKMKTIDKKIEINFVECDTCKTKPGSPILCAGCLYNRQIISNAGDYINYLLEKIKN